MMAMFVFTHVIGLLYPAIWYFRWSLRLRFRRCAVLNAELQNQYRGYLSNGHIVTAVDTDAHRPVIRLFYAAGALSIDSVAVLKKWKIL